MFKITECQGRFLCRKFPAPCMSLHVKFIKVFAQIQHTEVLRQILLYIFIIQSSKLYIYSHKHLSVKINEKRFQEK